MPSKLLTICYVHDSTERITRDYTIKEITSIVKLSDDDPKKIAFLHIKAFIPIDQNIQSKIDDFETGDTILLKGKFVPYEDYYIVRFLSNTNIFRKEKKSLNRSHFFSLTR